MLRQRLSGRNSYNPYDYTPKTCRTPQSQEKPFLSEWRLAVGGLIVSLLVIIAKISYANYDWVSGALIEPKLFSYEVLTEEGEVMFKYAWGKTVKYSRFWLPAVCGIAITYFTWIMVYLDSHQPGIQPPSPFSPTKYKTQSGHSFHLNYVFAVIIGILVASYLYWRGSSIEF